MDTRQIDTWQSALSLIGALGMFVLILFFTYLCTKYISKRYVNAGFAGRYIEVLERLPLGADRALLIVRIAGRVFLLGSATQCIELITELDASQFPQTPERIQHSPDFSAILKSALKSGWGIGTKPKDEKGKSDG